MEELHGEALLLVEPQRSVGAKADVAPLVIVEVEQPLRHAAALVFEGFLGEVLCAPHDVVEIEGGEGTGERRERESAADRDGQAAEAGLHVRPSWILHLRAGVISASRRATAPLPLVSRPLANADGIDR